MRPSVDFTIELPPGYRDREVWAFLGRDPEGFAEVVTPGRLRKGLMIEGVPAVLELERQDHLVQCRLAAEGRLSAVGNAEIRQAVSGMLGLRIAPEPFEARVHDDEWMGPIVRQQAGLRIPQTATPFEALTWAIIGQQITVAFATTLRRSLIRLADQRHASGLWCYPNAGGVAAIPVETLLGHKFSRAKAEALGRVAGLVESGELPLRQWQDELPADAEAKLLAIKGVGPWTVNYTLLRGFGLADCSLHGDSAVATALQRVIGGAVRPDKAEVERMLARYAPHRSLAAAHLWASLRLAA